MDIVETNIVQQKYIEIKKKIFINTNEIIKYISNLEKNIENVQNCNSVLHKLKENGVHVEDAFKPLDEQIKNMELEKNKYINKFSDFNDTLNTLKIEIKNKYDTPDKFGKLSFNK